MAVGEIKEYNGKTYISVKEHGCRGCALYSSVHGCEPFKSNTDMDSNCYVDNSVWKEYIADPKKKYYVEEVVDCLIISKWIAKSSRDDAIASVDKRIKLVNDPDYKTFLQLKEKFKDIE
jgi:hypothetical protein